MKIAFTTTGNDLAAPLDKRFGRAVNFLIYDAGNKTFDVVANAHQAAGQGAGIRAAETVARTGAVAVVSGDCGPKACDALKRAGIKIYSSKAATVAESLDLYLKGKLEEITGT